MPRLRTPGFTVPTPRPLLDELVDSMAALLGWSRRLDCLAAAELERLLYEALQEDRYADLETVCGRLRGVVCVAGSAASLERDLEDVGGCGSFVAADGAAEALLDAGVVPDVVIGDLDGRWSSLLEAARRGAIHVVHAHADNIPAARLIVPRLSLVAGTHQCPVHGAGLTLPPLGFTDGDKAVALALLCGARELRLLGMDTRGLVGPWSKPWLRSATKPWTAKRAKLAAAELLIAVLRARSPERAARPPATGGYERPS